MNNRLRFLILTLISLFVSCQQPQKKSFEDQAFELIKEVEKKTKEENRAKLSQNNFSQGVQEVIQYFDYVEPLISQYSNTKTIKSTLEFEKLKADNPLSVKSIYIDKNKTEILIDDISIFKNLEYLKIRNLDTFVTAPDIARQ